MKYFLFLILILTSLVILFSCTTSSPHNRGSLSDAMDKSRDDHEESREVPDEQDPFWTEDEEDSTETEKEEPETNENSPLASESMTLNILVRGERGLRGSPYFTSSFNGEILIGDGKNHWEGYLFAGFDLLEVKPTHPVYKSIKDSAFTLYAGVEGRYYIFPNLKLFSPYLLARLGGLFLFWQFQNPLISGSDTIESDILGGLLLGSGVGVDLFHVEDFRVGINIIPDASLYGDKTNQGFSNDYFNSQGVIRVGVELGARF